MTKIAAVAGILAGALVLIAPAFGEDAKPAGTSTTVSSSKPVDIEADQMEVLDKEKRTIFRGHVVAKRSDVTLNADTLTVQYADTPQADGTTKTDATRIDASGSVVIVTSKERITGDNATILPKTNEIDVTGNVTVVQGSTTIRGGHLHSNLDTHKMEMSGGRVRGSFQAK